jgi:hypothetical protein
MIPVNCVVPDPRFCFQSYLPLRLELELVQGKVNLPWRGIDTQNILFTSYRTRYVSPNP